MKIWQKKKKKIFLWPPLKILKRKIFFFICPKRALMYPPQIPDPLSGVWILFSDLLKKYFFFLWFLGQKNYIFFKTGIKKKFFVSDGANALGFNRPLMDLWKPTSHFPPKKKIFFFNTGFEKNTFSKNFQNFLKFFKKKPKKPKKKIIFFWGPERGSWGQIRGGGLVEGVFGSLGSK